MRCGLSPLRLTRLCTFIIVAISSHLRHGHTISCARCRCRCLVLCSVELSPLFPASKHYNLHVAAPGVSLRSPVRPDDPFLSSGSGFLPWDMFYDPSIPFHRGTSYRVPVRGRSQCKCSCYPGRSLWLSEETSMHVPIILPHVEVSLHTTSRSPIVAVYGQASTPSGQTSVAIVRQVNVPGFCNALRGIRFLALALLKMKRG